MKDFNNLKIINRNKIKFTDRKILIDLILVNEPLFKESEIIAHIEKAKDKRTYSTMTLIFDTKANELTNFETLTKGVLGAWDRGEFNSIGENTYLFYATLEPTASLIAKGRTKKSVW